MICVVANSYVKEDCLDEYLKFSKELVELTNALDKGCIRYELSRDVKDTLHFAMLEEWESMEDLNASMQAEHFKRIFPQMNSCRSKEGDIILFEKVL